MTPTGNDTMYEDIPNADIPDSDIPDSDIPNADIPDSDIPDSDIPDSDIPDSDIPDSDNYDVDVPDSKLFDLLGLDDYYEIAPQIVAYIRQRLADQSPLYNPGLGFNLELKKSMNPSGRRLNPNTYLGRLSFEEYESHRRAVNGLASLWGGKKLLRNEFAAANLVGSIALEFRLENDFWLAERYTYDPKEPKSHYYSRPVPSIDCADVIRRFEELLRRYITYCMRHESSCVTDTSIALSQVALESPFRIRWVLQRDELEGRGTYTPLVGQDRDEQAQLERRVWHHCTVRTAAELLGTLLLQPDYGMNDIALMESQYELLKRSHVSV